MAHIHTAPGHHDTTVSFFILRTDFEEPKLVYHVHRKTGMLSMFGGHVELHENPWQAALHEITEESGYEHSQLTILQPQERLPSLTGGIVHPVPVVSYTGRYLQEVPHFHSDSMYALVASEEATGKPEAGEATDIRLFTLAELQAVPADEILEAWREVGVYILTVIYPTWQRLPLSAFSGEEAPIMREQGPRPQASAPRMRSISLASAKPLHYEGEETEVQLTVAITVGDGHYKGVFTDGVTGSTTSVTAVTLNNIIDLAVEWAGFSGFRSTVGASLEELREELQASAALSRVFFKPVILTDF